MLKKSNDSNHKKSFLGSHKLYKLTSAICMAALLFSNSSSAVVLASSKGINTKSIASTVTKNEVTKKIAPIGKIENNNKIETSVCVKNANDIVKSKDFCDPPQVTTAKNTRTKSEVKADAKTYTMADLNRLSYNELVKLLVTIDSKNITDLFVYNQDAYDFYSNSNRMQALIDAVRSYGSQYTDSDTKGIPTLIEVIRAGYYLAYYNDQLSALNAKSYQEKCLPAVLAVEENTNFKLGTASQDQIVSSTGLLIWNTTTNVDIINRTIPIFNQYLANINTYINEKEKGTAIYNVAGSIEYDINNELYKGTKPASTIWYGKINGFIAQIENIALLGNVTSDNTWLINDGLAWMSTFGKVHSTPKEDDRIFTQAMSLYPYLSEQYFRAVSSISYYYNGVDYNGNTLNMEQIKKDGINKYLPTKYTFDGGKMVVYTGDKVAADKVKRLYWASNEVRAQFYREVGSDKALEANHADEILTCRIYNSPDEYKINSYLYGLETNNGGMYIEDDGAFYTYERTPQQSIYTLEELFRHEFTHYLQGRYLVPGMWGTSDFYKNNRLTWFEEGGAEWFAGSTRTDGIVPRKSMVGGIDRARRYTIPETLHASYDKNGFTFYTYAWAFYDYMYEKNPIMIDNLFDDVKSNNVSGYDSLISNYSSDSSLNTAYQNQMQYMVDNTAKYYTPLVADDYLADHPYKSAASVYSDITSVAGLTDVTTEVSQSEPFKTFTLRGKYTGAASQGRVADWENMNAKANEFLKTLAAYPWTGYKTLVCYFTNYKVNSSNNAEFDVVFHGILTDNQTPQNIPPVAEANGPYSGKKGTAIKLSSIGSNDTNGTIASYLWNFGDGQTSTEANPTHAYSTAGTFTATLTVTDNEGAQATDTATVTVTDVPAPGTPITVETEPNDTFDTANGPIVSGTPVSGNISEDDSQDIYYFDVTSDGKVDINVTAASGLKANWTLYKSSDLKNYVAYAASTKDGKLTGSYNASPGRYYLNVYNISGAGSYSININISSGSGGGGTVPTIGIKSETEPNDTFDTANGYISSGIPVSANFTSDDSRDIYYFEVTSAGKVDINVVPSSGLQMNWELFKASDLQNYVAYPTSTKDGKLTGSYNASPGKYYLYVYKISGTGSYNINVTGPLK